MRTPEQRTVAWIAGAIVALPLLHALSMGLFAYIANRGWIAPSAKLDRSLEAFYAPEILLTERFPSSAFTNIYGHYLEACAKQGRQDRDARLK